MSSVSGDILNTSENFSSEYPNSTIVSTHLTTEALDIQSPNQDGLLSQEPSSKVAVVLPIIRSFEVSSEQNNEGLNTQETADSSVSHNPSSDNSKDQNGSSVNEATSLRSEPKRNCRFYQRNGFCRFGKNCRYAHSLPDCPKRLPADAYVEEKPNKDENSDNNSQEIRKDNGSRKKDVCKFFSRKGFCLYGASCRYAHQIVQPEISHASEKQEISNVQTTLNSVSADQKENPSMPEVDTSQTGSTSTKPKSNRVCQYFYRYGDCRFGDSCKYRHTKPKPKKALNTPKIEKLHLENNSNGEIPNDGKTKLEEENTTTEGVKAESNQSNEESSGQPVSSAPKPVILRNKKRSDMTQADLSKLRATEVSQLKRKYPKCSETALPDIGTVFNLDFFPTDPDWRFDVKAVNINVMIPETYPEENLQVDLQNEEGILPEKLVRFFNKSTFTWLQDQQENSKVADEVQLIFRPFVKWLDKSLEDIFIGGLKMVKRDMEAKAAGLEFVTHEELNTINQSKKDTKTENDPIPDEEEYSPLITEYDDTMPELMDDISCQPVLMENVVDYRSVTETPKRGTEVKLRNLELLEAAASLTCSKLSVTVQCGRCKMRSDVSVAPHRSHRIVCERCHHQQKLVFRPQMLHQFSSVAGYLDLENCEVIDVPLLTCEFAIQCLPCGRQNFLSGVQYGHSHTTWCLFCHSKMAISVESTKLNQLQPNIEPLTVKAGQLLKLEKKEKRVKDPAVQEGKPLPENGTCKHYRKSFRWLRFPCCGKTYPCDACHDEKETDHEMKLANRMLCGFCAKEQPYSKDRPCVSCFSDMTKKTGTHWEGGKGCRDKVKMSRDDKQKYAGVNKTVSKKSTGTAQTKK